MSDCARQGISFRRRAVIRALACPLLAVPLGGCGLLRSIGLLPSPPPAPLPSPPAPTDYPLTLTISAAPDINPDPSGRASPLRLHVYADERDPQLGELGFETVFGTGTSGAGGNGSMPLATLVVAPGENTELALTPAADAVWVTVAAAYREPWSSLWTDSVRVDGKGASTVHLTLERTVLRLSPGSDP